jgi:elongation factor G
MKVYEGKDVRNIGIVGHGDSGKTSLVAAFLYTAGVTNRFTRVDEGTTVTDFDEEEVARKITITTSLAYVEWKKSKLNFLDTPGYNIFINDAKAALLAADAALVVVDGVSGVEVQTEKTWNFAADYDLPRVILINKLARDRSDFQRTLANVQETLSRKAVPVQLPIGSEKDFRGVVDLISGKAYTYQLDGKGKGQPVDIPADMAAEVESATEALLESVAECDDQLLNEYLENLTLPPEKLLQGLQKGVAEGSLFPVLCGSGLHNIGTDLWLDFLEAYVPPPTARGEMKGKDDGGSEVNRKISDAAPLSLFVYKTTADPFSGRVTYFKVVSGVLKNDENVFNYERGSHERFARIGLVFGKDITAVTEIHAGDLGAVAKLKDTLTGDTLGDKAHPIHYPKASIPIPSIAYAILAKTRQDEDRLSAGIQRILEEDASLQFYRDPQTKEFLLAGNGQQHLEIVVSKLKKRYHVEVELHSPKIPYRETIRGSADVQGRHKKQTGGHGQFGDCKIRMEPLERGKNFEFANEIFGGAIPKTYIPAVEKGIIEAAQKGPLAGYPVVDFKVSLYDGSYHDVDSSELAFKLAGRKAFRAAMALAKPTLLEPIMNAEIIAPMDFAGDLMGDLNSRRGRIQGMDTKGSNQVIRAQVPMAEMLTYANDLTSMTQGRGSFTMEFGHYDYVPQQFAEKVIAAAKEGREGIEEEEE